MTKPTIDDYLENGMYGQKQTKPDERRKFLGSLRERVVIALTQNQVREKKVYKEVEESLKEHKGAKLLLNGNMHYSYLTKYIKLAGQYGVSFSMVTNKETETEIGLLLAYDHAIDKEEIYVTKQPDKPVNKSKPKNKKGLFSSIKKKLF
ncbi:YueI family protein [Rossellomorea aquimaris]|uniref:YueI family protein n=1 Tax=Rossellomorea aquimaris TaxID=189382 RepID=UPI001CD42556|nr:YueI family protein [Rossellomorea aquimaris]MCA1056142.1 YueI family protein [Rossellomorea aquimaris]